MNTRFMARQRASTYGHAVAPPIASKGTAQHDPSSLGPIRRLAQCHGSSCSSEGLIENHFPPIGFIFDSHLYEPYNFENNRTENIEASTQIRKFISNL